MKRAMAMLPLVLTACMSDSLLGAADSGDADGSDHSSPPETGLDDTGLGADPVWFDVSGSLTLEAGRLTEGSLTISALPEDTSLGPICSGTYALNAEPVELVPDPVVFHWWDLELSGEAPDCPGADGAPRHLRLGLGELYPALEQGVDEHGLGGVKASLYGAYASFEAPVGDGLEGTTYAFGYGGTEQDRAGETTTATEPPMPDGTYQLTGYYLFRLP